MDQHVRKSPGRRRFLVSSAAALLHTATGTKGAVKDGATKTGMYPAWLRTQPLFTWFEIPGTKLSAVDPVPSPPGFTKNKVDAWNGAALQARDSVLWMGLSGGHADYAGNEIDRIVLSADTPRWEEVHPPSRLDFSGREKNWDVPYYQDGKPASRHTYNNQQFIDAESRLCWVGAGAIWGSGGRGSGSFDYWDVAKRQFGVYARTDGPDELRGVDSMVVKHPLTEDIYFSRADTGRYWKWTRESNSWRLVRRFGMSLSRCCAAIDPRSTLLLRIGPALKGSSGGLHIHAWEAGSGENGPGEIAIKGPAAAWFQAGEITKARGASLEWCGALNGFAYYCGHIAPGRVIVIDPATWTAEFLPVKGELDQLSKPQYNRFRYAPELKSFVLVDRWDANIKCCRISP